jgi:hypothetical protein
MAKTDALVAGGQVALTIKRDGIIGRESAGNHQGLDSMCQQRIRRALADPAAKHYLAALQQF